MGVSLATFVLSADHVNGPTDEVMSEPWLKAWASTVMVCPCDRQGS